MKPPCPARRHSQVALHLLDAGADPNRLDFSGRNVLDLAVLHGSLEVVEELLNMGCWFTGGSSEREGERVVGMGGEGGAPCVTMPLKHAVGVLARRLVVRKSSRTRLRVRAFGPLSSPAEARTNSAPVQLRRRHRGAADGSQP